MTSRQKHLLKLGFITLLWLLVAFLFSPIARADGTTHCPDHNTNTKYENGQFNDVVLPQGTEFCVKGSTDNTGKLVSDGVTTLFDYLDNGHDVSYYVIYKEVPSSTTIPTSTTSTTTPDDPTTTSTSTTLAPPPTTPTPSTSVPSPSSTSTPEETPSTSTPTSEPPLTPDTLPFTGPNEVATVAIIAMSMIAIAAAIASVLMARRNSEIISEMRVLPDATEGRVKHRD